MTTPPPPGPGNGSHYPYGSRGPYGPQGAPGPHPGGPPPGFSPHGGAPQPTNETPKILGIMSLVFGLIGIPSTCCCWFLGWIPAVVALVTGVIGLVVTKDDPHTEAKPFLVAGVATGAVGVLLVIAMMVLAVIGNTPGFYDTY